MSKAKIERLKQRIAALRKRKRPGRYFCLDDPGTGYLTKGLHSEERFYTLREFKDKYKFDDELDDLIIISFGPCTVPGCESIPVRAMDWGEEDMQVITIAPGEGWIDEPQTNTKRS